MRQGQFEEGFGAYAEDDVGQTPSRIMVGPGDSTSNQYGETINEGSEVSNAFRMQLENTIAEYSRMIARMADEEERNRRKTLVKTIEA